MCNYRNQNVIIWRQRLNGKEHERMFWGNRNFLYLVLCSGYMDVKSYQKVIKQHVRYVQFMLR